MNRYRVRFATGKPLYVDLEAETKTAAVLAVRRSTGRAILKARKLTESSNLFGRGVTVKKPECGEYSGYQTHRKRGEEPCTPCRAAASEYHRVWRIRTGQTETLTVRVDTLRLLAGLDPRARAVLASDIGEPAVDALENTLQPEAEVSG